MPRMPPSVVTCAALVALASVLTVSAADGQRAVRTGLHPEAAVAAITRAFDAYPLVAIGEVHRNQQLHDLLVTVVRDARFLPNGGDIVVEFGNARYQDRIDRYIGGETVDQKSLAQVWREAVNILVWDAPVYERFFATVRDVNRTRPAERYLRVVLADPAFDWATVGDRATWERIAARRDQHAADVIQHEVLARGRRALLIFGSAHVEREQAFERHDKPRRPRSSNLLELLDAEHPGGTLYVTADWGNGATDALLARWRPPVLLRLKGTSLGEIHAGPSIQGPRLDELADAYLYLGPTSSLTTSVPAPSTYADPAYLRELLRRDAIQGGANAAELRRLSAQFLNGRTR